MADILKVYRDGEVVGQGERDENNKGEVNIDGLEANSVYEKGTFKTSWTNDHGESEKEDVPEFKTKPIKVTGVTLDQTELELDIDGTATLQASVAPSTATDKSVAFTSSDETITKVNRETGEVTGVAPGTANIVATTIDGNKTAKATITVTEETPEDPQNVNGESNETDADVSAE